jgi:glycerol uptake facilitator-like aquaporin
MDMKQCVAEFTGTALLMYMTNYSPNNPMVWGVSFAVLTFMFGAAMNPAVSVAKIIKDPSTAVQNGANVGAQIAGSICGGFLFLINSAFEESAKVAMSSTMGAKTEQAVLTEIIITFVLVTIVFGASKATHGHFDAIFVGMGYYLAYTMNAHASFNPAASFGGSLVNTFHGHSDGAWTDHWIYWVGPIVGAAIAAVYDKFLAAKDDEEAAKEETPSPA